MQIAHIVAVSENGIIGRENTLPWSLPDDLMRFKELTMHKTVIMGRRTYESLPKKLEGRQVVVVSKTMAPLDDVVVCRSVEEALKVPSKECEIIIAGGGEIYRETMHLVDKVYLTVVHQTLDGDTTYPMAALDGFISYPIKRHEGSPSFTFYTLIKK